VENNEYETGIPIFPTPIQYSSETPSQSNKTIARNKMIQVRNEDVKLSLFADDMIVYIKGLGQSTSIQN
jgi:hypothetical protein